MKSNFVCCMAAMVFMAMGFLGGKLYHEDRCHCDRHGILPTPQPHWDHIPPRLPPVIMPKVCPFDKDCPCGARCPCGILCPCGKFRPAVPAEAAQ